MKKLRYEWDDEIWLLHLEAENTQQSEGSVIYSRIKGPLQDRSADPGNVIILKPKDVHRFIISRKTTEETAVDIVFDKGIILKVYKLMDRAYLPGDSDMVYCIEG